MKSCGPFSAATAAAWLIDDVCVVDCDWIMFMAAISGCGPAPQPTRQPVMLYAFEQPLIVQCPVIEARLDLRRRGETESVVDDVLVDVVGHHPDVRVAQQHLADRRISVSE